MRPGAAAGPAGRRRGRPADQLEAVGLGRLPVTVGLREQRVEQDRLVPSAASRSATCDPTNPAPPVTRTRTEPTLTTTGFGSPATIDALRLA